MFDVESIAPELWKEIKELEQREAEAMLRADVPDTASFMVG